MSLAKDNTEYGYVANTPGAVVKGTHSAGYIFSP